MGACDFRVTARGANARSAFDSARAGAQAEYGNNPYSCTIATKAGFRVFALPDGKTIDAYVEELMDDGGPIATKFDPAGCIRTGEDTFLFFGWARC